MTLHILSKQDTVLNKFIAQIRDKSVPEGFDALPP